jgi:hypothetical protein
MSTALANVQSQRALRCFGVVALAMLFAIAAHAQEFPWPSPAVPDDAVLSSPGEVMAVNGMPLKIFRYETTASHQEIARVFRASIEGNFVRREPAGTDPRVSLAGRAGGFWITLQIAPPQAGRTVAVWSAAPRFLEGVKRRVVTPPGFPPDAQLLQHVDSYDDDKHSQMAVGHTQASVDAAVARFLDRMHELGYTKQPFPARNWASSTEYSAVFANGREEIVVSMQQEAQGTAVVFNRISALERLQ